jgi:hypothetical protein
MVVKPEVKSVEKPTRYDSKSNRQIDYLDYDVNMAPSKSHSLPDPEPITRLPGLPSDTKTIAHKSSPFPMPMRTNIPSKMTSYTYSSKAFNRPNSSTSNSMTSFSQLPATPPHDMTDADNNDNDDKVEINYREKNFQIREKRTQYFSNLPKATQPAAKKQRTPLNNPAASAVATDLSCYFDKGSDSIVKYLPRRSEGGIANLGNTCYMAAVMQVPYSCYSYSSHTLIAYTCMSRLC